MKPTHLVLAAVSGLATTWLTDQIMRRASLPAVLRPVVSIAAGAAVAKAVQRLR
ncbi:hypothetical protein [Couchioplanes caeruleus]|uniref:Uncharacterized protein n=1 Tax=Couchioplanes caeruleus TaxID=56438 RepID=A0A3N1GFA9_9ACTN|nr:hypothetical protein [Couchioplanes caeruleus]ROP28989.1 hypothetical protein EDD30_1770 [Couchioplanes caeruleus]